MYITSSYIAVSTRNASSEDMGLKLQMKEKTGSREQRTRKRTTIVAGPHGAGTSEPTIAL